MYFLGTKITSICCHLMKTVNSTLSTEGRKATVNNLNESTTSFTL